MKVTPTTKLPLSRESSSKNKDLGKNPTGNVGRQNPGARKSNLPMGGEILKRQPHPLKLKDVDTSGTRLDNGHLRTTMDAMLRKCEDILIIYIASQD